VGTEAGRSLPPRTVTPERLALETDAIGKLQGRLRAVHFAAHLEMRAVLTPEQFASYDRLKGYVGGAKAPPAHSHYMAPG